MSGVSSKERKEAEPKRALRTSTRPSRVKEIGIAELSAHFGIPLDGSDSESSDQEFAPPSDSNLSSEGSSSGSAVDTSDDDMEVSDEEKDEESVSGGESVNNTYSDFLSNVTPGLDDAMMDGAINKYMYCCVCLEPSKDDDMVTCDKCGVTVHEGCYGVPEESILDDSVPDISSPTVPWFCDPCRAGEDHPMCELCPNDGGIYKQVITGRWVHMVCCLYCSSVEYIEPKILSGVSLDQVPISKFGSKSCQLCTNEWYSRTGVCISCDAGLCKAVFHVTCAQKEGYLLEVEDSTSIDNDEVIADPFYAHCNVHCDKMVARTKRKRYKVVVQRAQKAKEQRLANFGSELKKSLLAARAEYNEHFADMRGWYSPENASRKQVRLLHHSPSAFKLLNKKAQLLGYETQVARVPQNIKSHLGIVSIGLNLDFVKFFNEREGTITKYRKDNEGLNLRIHTLKEKHAARMEEKKELEEELGNVQDTLTGECNKMEAIYKKINDVLGEDANDRLFSETHSPSDETDSSKPRCVECNSCHNDHLMTQCDTCNKYYHIHCLDPPLTRVPKKSTKYGWQCEDCCCDSEDEMKPCPISDNEPQSRFGRRLVRPRLTSFTEYDTSSKKKSKKADD